MPLFSKKANSIARTAGGNSNGVISSVISKDMRINGEVSFKGKARIDGVVEGNIQGEHLILSENGKVRGDLKLASLVCHGSVEGNITAQQVTAHSTSSVHGNLAAVSLTVEPGARLNGEISASSQQKEEPKKAAAAAAVPKEGSPPAQAEKK